MPTRVILIKHQLRHALVVLGIAGTMTVASASPGMAQESFTRLAELRIHHFTKPEVIVMDSKGNRVDTARLDSEMRFGVPSNTRLKIVIVDPNPLLYKYAFKGVESSPSQNYKAIEQLAAVLQPFAESLKKLAQKPLDAANKGWELASVAGPRKSEYAKLLDDLSTGLGKLATMAGAVKKATVLSVTDPTAAKALAAEETKTFDDLSAQLEQSFEDLEKAGSKILLDLANPHPDTGAITLALHYEPETKDTIKAISAFRTDAAAIGVPLDIGDVSFVAGQIQTATFSITLRDDATDPLKASRGAGQFKAIVEPLSPVAYSFAPGYVYTWVRKVAGVSNQQMAGILNVTPRRWISSDFSAGFNLGVTGTDAGLGVMAGMSVTLARGVQVGLGAIYRDVGKDGRDFRPGGYLLLAVDLGKKK